MDFTYQGLFLETLTERTLYLILISICTQDKSNFRLNMFLVQKGK